MFNSQAATQGEATHFEVAIPVADAANTFQPATEAVLSDEALIAQICHQQEHALARLYDRYSQLLYTIALRVTGDRRVAEEVIQDVFLAVWQSARSFRTDQNARAWLLGITRHRAIDVTRARHFHAQQATVTLDERLSIAMTDETELIVISKSEREQIRGALAYLPDAQRIAIELAYYGGFTCAEIAAQVSVPLGTVKTRLRLGLLKLRTVVFSDLSTA